MSGTKIINSNFIIMTREKNPIPREMTLKEENNPDQVGSDYLESLAQQYRHWEAMGQVFVGAIAYQVMIDPDCKSFSFSHQDRILRISPQLIESKNLDSTEQKYVYCHELAHLSQLMNDPDAYVSTFDTAKQRAKEYEDVTTQTIVRQSWNRYFNIFLDIHDNARVKARMPEFQRFDESGFLLENKLYQKLFSGVGSEKSLSEQFLNTLILRQMSPNTKTDNLFTEVEDKINQPINYLGEHYDSLTAFIRKNIADPKLQLPCFLSRLQRVIEPIFQKLLDKDLEQGRLSVDDSKKSSTMIGQPLDEKTARKIADEVKKSRQSGSKRASDAILEQLKADGAKAGFSESDVRRQIEICRSADEIMRSMMEIWDYFVKLVPIIKYEEESGYRSGKNVSVSELVKQFPDFINDPDKLRIFIRDYASSEQESFQPKFISLYLLPDLSGSMDADKRRAVQEVFYCWGQSLINYRRNLALDFADGEDIPLGINIRPIGFGSKAVDLMPPTTTERESDQLSIDKTLTNRLWMAIKQIGQLDLSGTEDALALEMIQRELSNPERQQRIQTGDELVIVLEITDGETTTEALSGSLVNQINEQGAYARAIQIPGLIWDETKPRYLPKNDMKAKLPATINSTGVFERVWQENGIRLNDLVTLKRVALKILARAIEDHNINT